MTERYKFSLKTICLLVLPIAFCNAITSKYKALRINSTEIYQTLTTDTIPKRKIDSLLFRNDADSLRRDTLPAGRTDSFTIRISKDTLDAPVEYEASDSGVLYIKDKKFYLYSKDKTKVTHKDITLTAPTIEFNQATNIVTASRSVDSLGDIRTRAEFHQGEQGFQSDTIRFSMKTMKGLTRNTLTKQEEFFVGAEDFKKVGPDVVFARRVIMTTCNYDHPHFGFVSARGKFVTGKLAITGAIHPEFEGVPVPVYLPFGLFPLSQGRHSGLLPPQFSTNEQLGIGLEGLGYYQVLNEYLDVTLRTNVYSYGSWTANFIPTYRKRYKYQGSMSINVQRTKRNFKNDPDFSVDKTFNIAWNHSVDPKARPGTSFSASVNAGSSKYNSNVTNNAFRNFQNQLTSTINYTKTWQDQKDRSFNLSVSANHNQNTQSRLINIMLPDVGFTMSPIYPLQRRNDVGTKKWYENVSIGYNAVARNQIAFYDTAINSFRQILDTALYGFQHRFPINVALPPLGPILVAPFVSYEETWLTNRITRQWNPFLKTVELASQKDGLFIDRQMSFGINLNTALYGTSKEFKRGRLKQIRHVMRPTVSVNYRPNLSKRYYDDIQTDVSGRHSWLPQFENTRNLYSGYGYGRFGGMSFGIDNNIEAKIRSRKDTGAAAEKKIKLIDGFGVTSSYNFLDDSLRLKPFNLYLRTTLFEKVSITAQALYNPYQRDPAGIYINQFVWQGDRFRLGRINSGSISMSTNFQSKPRDPKKDPVAVPVRQITDPTLLAEQDRLQDYIRRNPAEFVDFNIPYTFGISYSLTFNEERRPDSTYKTKFYSNVSFNNSFSLTPKWNFTVNGYYDFNSKQITMLTMSISREMHCWQMSVNVTPVGLTRYFNIAISPKSALLQDLKINRNRTFYTY